jgi:cell division septation protein DedD
MTKLLILATVTLLLVACPKKNSETIITDTTMDTIAEQLDLEYQTENQIVVVDNPGDSPTTPPTTPPVTPPVTPPTTPSTTTPTTTGGSRSVEQGDFTVQFMSLTERDRADAIRIKLDNASYFSEIQEVNINGEIRYRIRLRGGFSHSYATYLAERIKAEIDEINDYWVTRR